MGEIFQNATSFTGDLLKALNFLNVPCDSPHKLLLGFGKFKCNFKKETLKNNAAMLEIF